MGYVKNDPRHVQSRPKSSSCDVFMSSLAMCQEVMTTGVHTVQFRVISKSGSRIKLGVIRPIEDLNTESVKTFDLNVARPLYSDWFYASRENFTTQREFIDYCNERYAQVGNHCAISRPITFYYGPILVEIQLDLNEGCMKSINRSDNSEIFRQSGLAGPYCWCAVISAPISKTAIRVTRIAQLSAN